MKRTTRALILFLIPILLVSLACQATSSKQIEQVVKESTQQTIAQPTEVQDVVSKDVETSVPEKEPTATQKPTVEPTPETQPLDLSDDLGFIQNNTAVTVIFFVSNPNESLAIEDSDYQATVYDQAGTVLSTDNGYIAVVLPGETVAYATSIYLQEGQVADRVEVQTVSGDFSELDVQGPLFTISKAEFIAGDYSNTVTGMIQNGLNRDVTDLRVTAVAYDEEGKIVGGGMTWVDFIPAESETGVEIYVDVAKKPARVEIYPAFSGLTQFEEDDQGDVSIELVDFGYGLEAQLMSVVFLVKNTSTEMAVTNSQYQTIIYDQEGNVLTTDSGYFDYIFPGETTAGHSSISIPEGKKMERVEVQINTGDPEIPDLMTNPITYDPPTLRQDDYSAKVYTTLHNGHEMIADDIEMVAVAYDKNGEIIGGGYSYANFIPAGGSAAVDVSVTVSGEADHFELYPCIYSWSTFKDVPSKEVIALTDSGFAQSTYDSKAIFELEITDTEFAYESSEYQVAAYTADGEIVATDSGYLPVLMPGTKFAYASGLYIIGTAKIDHIEIQIFPGDPAIVEATTPLFTIEQATFLDDTYTPKVTGIVASSVAKDLQSVLVTAVLYDESGAIIGGGYGFADLIPANGQTAVELYVTVNGTPARVELFAAPSSLTEIQ